MDNIASQKNTFQYRYSAKENQEVWAIRKKYLPQTESKLDELKRLDGQVQSAGLIEGLVVGISGLLVFGLGMCLAMQVLGSGTGFLILGVIVGIAGAVLMGAAYPLHRRAYKKAKEKYTPRILELTAELTGEENTI